MTDLSSVEIRGLSVRLHCRIVYTGSCLSLQLGKLWTLQHLASFSNTLLPELRL